MQLNCKVIKKVANLLVTPPRPPPKVTQFLEGPTLRLIREGVGGGGPTMVRY